MADGMIMMSAWCWLLSLLYALSMKETDSDAAAPNADEVVP